MAEAEPQHRVYLKHLGPRRGDVMDVLQQATGLGRIEVIALMSSGDVICEASAAEVTALTQVLLALGAEVTIVPPLLAPEWKLPPPVENVRRQHYDFVHRALRQFTAEDPARLWNALTNPGLADLLPHLWNRIGELLPPEQRLEPTGLCVEVRLDGGAPMLVIHLPKPLAMAEAYMAALVRIEDPARLSGTFQFRYFTLERGFDHTGGRTVLAQWRDGAHLNYGTGPEPTAAAFQRAVTELLRAGTAPNEQGTPSTSLH